MSETWKFNGTLANVPAISSGTGIAISGKAYLDDTLYATFTQLYYNDTSKYLEIGDAGYWDGINSKYGRANILVFDTAPTGTLLTFLQTYATKQQSLHDQIEQQISDAYEAINNKSGTIPTAKNLQNLAGAIDSISSGTDTSDATATAADILKDKTAYVATGKVSGTIETYNGETEDVGGNS